MLSAHFLFTSFSLLLLEAAIVGSNKLGPNRVYHLNSDEGEISPTDGSGVYLPYTKLRWVITSPSEKNLYLTFDPKFGVEPAKYVACLDHVTIYNAATFNLSAKRCAMHMNEPIGRYCGYKQPIVNRKVPSSIVVEFCTAPGEPEARNIGFKLRWQVASPPAPTTPTTQKPLSDRCGLVNKYATPLIEIDENDEVSDYGQTVGSHEARPNSWPWMGAVFRKDSFACAGTLVSEDMFVTTASCLRGWPEEAYVKFGAHDHGSTIMETELSQSVCQVRHQIRHPMFEKLNGTSPNEAKSWDIAVLKFHCSGGLNSNVTNVCLSKGQKSLAEPTLAVVAGWGINPNENVEERIQPFPLREAVVTVNSKEQACIHPYTQRSYQNALCISPFENGNFYPSVDLGSPLLRHDDDRWILDGISTGETYPGEGMPTMFLDVGVFANWIEEAASQLQLEI